MPIVPTPLSYSRLVRAFKQVGDGDLSDILNSHYDLKLMEDDLVDVDLSKTSTKLYVDYLSISVDGISFKFVFPKIGNKILFAPNSRIPLKLKGSGARPHAYLPLGKYQRENIFVLFYHKEQEPNYRQPTLLDQLEANLFYLAVARALSHFNKGVFIANGAETLVDTSFKDPFTFTDLDTVYSFSLYSHGLVIAITLLESSERIFAILTILTSTTW